MYQNLLPLGSVVRLIGAERNVIIVGRVVANSADEKVYEYVSVPTPTGLNDEEDMIFFNTDAIEEVFFIGCKNELEIRFREEVLDKISALGELVVVDGQIVAKE